MGKRRFQDYSNLLTRSLYLDSASTLAEIKGIVLEAWTERAVPRARVMVEETGAITISEDSTGRFRLHGLAEGEYHLIVTADNYTSAKLAAAARDSTTSQLVKAHLKPVVRIL